MISQETITTIRRIMFDRIEDDNILSQDIRRWLLDTLESITATFLICEFYAETYDEFDRSQTYRIEYTIQRMFEDFLSM